MGQYVDTECPDRAKYDHDYGRLAGTRWLNNTQVKKWYMVKRCPYCKGIHEPANIRKDRLVIPKD